MLFPPRNVELHPRDDPRELKTVQHHEVLVGKVDAKEEERHGVMKLDASPEPVDAPPTQ